MTKAQLLSEVSGKSWYGGLLGSVTLDTEWPSLSVKLYRGHVKVLKTGNVLSTAHIYFYVFNEGVTGSEVAYYKDRSPDEQAGVA